MLGGLLYALKKGFIGVATEGTEYITKISRRRESTQCKLVLRQGRVLLQVYKGN